jgi:hypothetical protein
MDPLAQIDLVVGGGAVFSAIVTAVGLVIVATINGRDAAKREERQYARQDEVAERLQTANARAEVAAREAATHSVETRRAFADVAADTKKIELATNSMKDALVAATAAASSAEGEKRGIEIGVAQSDARRAADLDRHKLEQQEDS